MSRRLGQFAGHADGRIARVEVVLPLVLRLPCSNVVVAGIIGCPDSE